MSQAEEHTPEYAAWIPNVSGHLSFSAVGVELLGGAAIYNNLNRDLPEDVRCVVAAQRRLNRDSWVVLRWLGYCFGGLVRRLLSSPRFSRIPITILDWFPTGHVQHFFLVGSPASALSPYFDRKGGLQHRHDARGSLEGRVFIIGEETGWRNRRAQRRTIRAVIQEIECLSLQPTEDKLRELITQLEGNLKANADVLVDFTIYRTGECRLRMNRLPLGAEGEVNVDRVMRHAYYFVRDCAHRHYHHSRNDDRLLPAVRIQGPGSDGDTPWRREVLWALTRTVGEYRRSRSMAHRRQALGVIAYAEAFQATLSKIRRPGALTDPHVADFSLDTFDFSHLRESIKVANEVGAWHRQGIFAAGALTLASTLSFLAFWVSASRLAEVEHWTGSSYFTAFVRWVFMNQGFAFGLVLSLIYVLWDLIYFERSKVDIFFKTFIAFSWPGRRARVRAGKSLYLVTLLTSLLILFLLYFQFGFTIV